MKLPFKPPVILTIEAGTTNISAALIDGNGAMWESVSAPTDVLRPFDGASEMNMTGLWDGLCALCKRLAGKTPELWREIGAVAITGQGDGLWPLDEALEPNGNAILWNDTRTRMLGYAGDEELDAILARHNSTAMFAGAFPLILKWLKLNEPERYRRTAHVLRCKDYLNFKLTGRICSECTDSSTAGINVFTKRYVPELFAFLGIPEAISWMPEVIGPTDIAGTVSGAAAWQAGIPEGTPVVGGAIDVVATAYGAGLSQSGDGCTILGATLCCEMLLGEVQVDPRDRSGSALCSVLPQKYIRVIAANSGTSTIEWAKEVFAPHLTFLELEAALQKIPPGSRGILFHPYLCGERAPFRNGGATGGFFGLSAFHGKLDMLRAVYEGMVLAVKDCYHALPKTSGIVYLCGSGAASDFTCGLIASALGRRVLRPRRKELALLGIAKTAKLGLGLEPSGNFSDTADIFNPDPVLQDVFDEIYEPFVELRGTMLDFWSWRLAQL